MNFNQNQKEIYDVIILGAGISGIGAANYLKENNISYLVLQAQDKIGGRIQKHNIDGLDIDIGAYQLQGYVPGNPVYQFMKKHNWPIHQYSQNSQIIYYDQHQGKFSQQTVQKIKNILQSIIDQYHKLQKEKKKQLIKISLFTYLEPILQNYKQKLSKSQYRLLHLLLNMFEQEDAGSLQLFSTLLLGFQQEQHKEKDCYALPKGTYANLVYKMGQNLNIKLNQKVNFISYHNEICQIKTSASSYYSKNIICTIPLGTLKQNIIKFEPELSEFHKKLIDKIGCGIYNKILLTFNKPFWDESTTRLKFACDQRGKYSHFLNMSENNVYVLCCFVADHFCIELNKMSDEQIFQDAVNFLKNQLKNKQIIFKQGFYTRWETNQFIRGAFSFLTPEIQIEDMMKMREGIQNKLWLAGQYLYLQNMGTAHGACITGIMAGQKIMKKMNISQIQNQ